MGVLGTVLWWILKNSDHKADQIQQLQEQVQDRIRLNALGLMKGNEKKRKKILERQTVGQTMEQPLPENARVSSLRPVNSHNPFQSSNLTPVTNLF